MDPESGSLALTVCLKWGTPVPICLKFLSRNSEGLWEMGMLLTWFWDGKLINGWTGGTNFD